MYFALLVFIIKQLLACGMTHTEMKINSGVSFHAKIALCCHITMYHVEYASWESFISKKKNPKTETLYGDYNVSVS